MEANIHYFVHYFTLKRLRTLLKIGIMTILCQNELGLPCKMISEYDKSTTKIIHVLGHFNKTLTCFFATDPRSVDVI